MYRDVQGVQTGSGTPNIMWQFRKKFIGIFEWVINAFLVTISVTQ
jgi:hypothetical protein